MLKSHEKFHSANGKRLILIVDDEAMNRELLGFILQSQYEIIFAENGAQALETVREYRETLSLILLDLIMPEMNGLDVLKALKEDAESRHIPVIVMTSAQSAEVESLRLGASDFIPKPYPQAEVILARILRTIELSEDRQIINSTERDPLTGLYNREYFYRYAEQFDQHHKGMEMDAIVVDVSHFHMINERYGRAYGDEVLRRIGEKVREMVLDTGGIVCRREADTFMVYCPHGKDYEAILGNASIGLAGDGVADSTRVRLRMGVYSNCDKEIDIERRFDRAKMAADTIRNVFTRSVAIYDDTLQETELYDERLLEDFQAAVKGRQFEVWYQPKFDIRPEKPFLTSAEALVRWRHPEMGMISPGKFIPLFEENGLIRQLDEFVWEETAAQIHIWKERFGLVLPVSVNVSRIDMYDAGLIDTFTGILEKNGLTPPDLILEITESAYTEDSEQIIAVVDRLREIGFHIEMDDFGTGYSSLGMISHLPLDALKLDMMFVRNAFSAQKDVRMLELIIDIADYLSVPVIAEGVETAEQLAALRSMGCDIVQGYYFSKPVPAEEFDRFIEERVRGVSGAGAELERAHAAEAVAAVSAEMIPKAEHQAAGEDVFDICRKNILYAVNPEDREKFAKALRREVVVHDLAETGVFSLNFRLAVEGQPAHAVFRVMREEEDD